MNREQLDELQITLRAIQNQRKLITGQNFTEKTTGGKYPTRLGYSLVVQRPFRDLIRWMKGVEKVLETLITEAG